MECTETVLKWKWITDYTHKDPILLQRSNFSLLDWLLWFVSSGKKCNHWAPLKISDIPLLSTLGTTEHIELCRIKIYSETLPIFMRSSLRTRAIDICCRAFKFGSPRFQWDSINPPFEYEINPWTQYEILW